MLQYYLVYINMFYLGVFATQDIPSGSFICSIPTYFFPTPKLIDHHRHYVWEYTPFGKSIDSTCLKKCITLPDGFGQFINTSHPNSAQKIPNSKFWCGENYNLICKAHLDIKKGDEILCDYHWQLAVIDKDDGFEESSAAVAAGELCFCPKCQETRENYVNYISVMKSVKKGRYSIWEKASAHVSQLLLLEYFKQMHLSLSAKRDQGQTAVSIVANHKSLLLLRECDMMIGVGISEFSWRSILDTLKVHPLDGGRMVQVGSSFGIEALLAAMYKPELEFSISVMVSSRNREVFADDVEVALKTFRECLLPSSPTFEATLLTGPNALSTVITPFQDCWTTLGITHLVIGEGVDDSPDALDLNFAETIIDAAKDTLVYVLTPSNDLQSLLLYRRSGWMVSGYRKKRDPVISCYTGETIFFAELYRDPRRLKNSRQI